MTAVQKKKYIGWGVIATGIAVIAGVFTAMDYSFKWGNNITQSYHEVYNIKDGFKALKEEIKEHVDVQRLDFDNVDRKISKVSEDVSDVKQEVARISGMLKVIIKSKDFSDNQRIEIIQDIEHKDKKEFTLYKPLTNNDKIN